MFVAGLGVAVLLFATIWSSDGTETVGDMYLGSVGTNTGVSLKLEIHGSTAQGLIQFLNRERVRVEFTGQVTANLITGRFTDFNRNERGTVNLSATSDMKTLTGSWQEWPETEPEPSAFQRVGQLARRTWRSGLRIHDRGQRLHAEMAYPVLPSTNVFAHALADTVEAVRRNPPQVEEGVTWDMVKFGLRYGGMRDWESKTAIDIVHLTDTCMSLRVFGWADTGGAHGNWTVFGINFVRDGDQVTELSLEDLFVEGSGWQETVVGLVAVGLREQQASGVLEDGFTMAAPDLAFTIGTQGLTCLFSPYQVASYAEGAFLVTVPWESLRPQLRPHIIPDRLLHEKRHE